MHVARVKRLSLIGKKKNGTLGNEVNPQSWT